ncbi:hypothetical protein RND81_12G173600 [Saponaria officinalis]|uniref:Conserved oligomeric Golgi complex subunit 1 n=1 Tax=Saponaria officinalis TaxID=3572 RepID=A0AAW1HBX5_SAPOF
MRISSVDKSTTMSGAGFRDAESLFRSKPVSEIRNVEAETRRLIDDKKEELRQLIGNRYRDLIDSADSILLMKSSCESISSNVSSINGDLFSLSDSSKKSEFLPNPNPNRVRIYGIASRVKYLVDTPENIWGCLDEFMFLEASARYIRAKLVYEGLNLGVDDVGRMILRKNFPLLNHQWQIVESFKGQISQRSREKLMLLEKRAGYDVLKVEIGAFADALAGVAIIDELDPRQAFGLFLESRKGWILQRLNGFDWGNENGNGNGNVVSVLCEVTKIIQVTLAQVGEMFLQVLNDMPLFYKVILGSPPASQLFGGIPNPDEEVRLWNEFRETLESVMVILDRDSVARSCSSWLRECGREIVKKVDGRCLIDAISNGVELASAEKLVREIMDSKDVLEGSLEWLKSVFGSDVELPWSRTRELVLEESVDLWDEIFEDAFVSRMKVIVDSGFEDLIRNVNVPESISSVGSSFTDQCDFRTYLHRSSASGGVWFTDTNVKKAGLVLSVKTLPEEFDFGSCLSAYFGPEASRIRDAVDSCCNSLLKDLLSFLESPKASLRLNHLAPYLQNKCYESISIILTDLKNELDKLHASLENANKGNECQSPATIIEKSLFIGRLLFALLNHSKHISVVLGSPRFWVSEARVSVSEKLPSFSTRSRFSLDSVTPDSPGMQIVGISKRQSLVSNALFGVSDTASPKLEEVISSMRDLCIAAHGLWISWVSDELANILSEDLRMDDGLLATIPLRGWEEVVVKQDPSSGSDSEMKILLPSLPSLYIASFLFRACEEVHRVGGHVLDKVILQRFAKRLLEKVIEIYSEHITNGAEMSDKGVLQVLLDLRFAADILSGCDSNMNEGVSKSPSTKSSFRRKQEKSRSKSAMRERVDDLVNRFSRKLDPIDWQTFEPYLWENERQSYLRHAVLFGFFVQLNRLYTDTVQKLPTNAESNIMRCSVVPRFKYLPISAPALPSRASTKKPMRTSSDDVSARGSLKAYANGEFSQKIDFDDNSSFGAATPFLKSFMQVGSRFGEGTFKLGSILNDARFKDKAAAMSSFGDILPVQAAGLLSSFTATRSDS